MLLSLAAFCLPAFTYIPRTALVAENPHQGVERFAPGSRQGLAAANVLIEPGIAGCLGDESGKSRSTGKARDSESDGTPTGLDYFGARYMSAAMGRFPSADAPFADQNTSDPQSWSLYSYTRNNPLRCVDPTGK